LSFLIGLGGLFLSYVAGPQILTILFRPQYAAYVEIFQLTMMVGAVLFLAAALGASLTAARVFKPQVKLLAIVAIVQALGCWILTPRLGLKGAVIACLIAAVAQFAGTGLILAVQWARRTPVACAPVSVS